MKTLKFIASEIGQRPIGFFFLWQFTIWVFQYLTDFSLFTSVLTNPALSFIDKINFFLDSIKNIFIYASDPRALSIIIFSFIASVNFLLMFAAYKRKQALESRRAQTASTVGALIGTHCVACGGSLLAPLVTTIAGSGAYFSSSRIYTGIFISVVINLIAIVFLTRATLKMARKQMHFQPVARI